jgi:hypothetical protein
MRNFTLFLLLLPFALWAKEKNDDQPKEVISFFHEKTRSFDNTSHIDDTIIENFSIDDNWTVEGQWQLTPSGENMAFIGKNGSYLPNINSRIVSPNIDLPEISYEKKKKSGCHLMKCSRWKIHMIEDL